MGFRARRAREPFCARPGGSQIQRFSRPTPEIWVVKSSHPIGGPKFAIVRAWCTKMENGLNDTNGTKMGKTWKTCPDRKWGKSGRKISKKWKSGQCSIFSVVCGHFPHFRSGQIFHVFPIFPIFVVRARFPLCVPGPHDCNPTFGEV